MFAIVCACLMVCGGSLQLQQKQTSSRVIVPAPGQAGRSEEHLPNPFLNASSQEASKGNIGVAEALAIKTVNLKDGIAAMTHLENATVEMEIMRHRALNAVAPMKPFKVLRDELEQVSAGMLFFNDGLGKALCELTQTMREERGIVVQGQAVGIFESAEQCLDCAEKKCNDAGVEYGEALVRDAHCRMYVRMCKGCGSGGLGCLGPNDVYLREDMSDMEKSKFILNAFRKTWFNPVSSPILSARLGESMTRSK